MHVGIDGRELVGHVTGVGRFLQGVLQEWARSGSARRHHYTVYSPDARIALPPELPGEVVLVPGAGGTRWEQQSLAVAVRRDSPDVFFAPGYSAPMLAGVPLVVAIHDVSFAAHPEWFRWREGLRRRLLARWSAKRAASVITISNFSRDEIVRHLRVSSARIRVVPLGATPAPVGRDRQSGDGLVLFVGTILNRRHVPVLLEAFAEVAGRQPTARLELVGNDRTHPPQHLARLVAASAFSNRIRLRPWVADDELAALYAQASAFVFLSEYEGFGLTPLEALAAGVPPVVLDTAVAREVLGAAALFIDRPDPREVASAITTALDAESPARRGVLEAAPGVLARYRWPDAAASVLAALEEAARS